MTTRGGSTLTAALLPRCTFPPPGTDLPCAVSGGPDSTALLALAIAADCVPVAHHVDHGLRDESGDEANHARQIAERLDVPFVLHTVDVTDGPNLEARARAARRAALPSSCATGHTLDDQAETVLINLLRGAGASGVAAMTPSPTKPLLRVRRHETQALCAELEIETNDDPTNASTRFLRNRIRHELLPLLDDLAERDVAPLLARTADLARADDELLDVLAGEIDPTDAKALAAAPAPLAHRALRSWLAVDGYAPHAAAIDRVMAVVRGDSQACELPSGVRVSRTAQRLRRVDPPPK